MYMYIVEIALVDRGILNFWYPAKKIHNLNIRADIIFPFG